MHLNSGFKSKIRPQPLSGVNGLYLHNILNLLSPLVMPLWLGLCVYVGWIEISFCNPLSCCNLYLSKDRHHCYYHHHYHPIGQSCDPVGLFASRAPHRPNPIALSALKVTSVDVAAGIIHVFGLDLLDGTPVLGEWGLEWWW
jgi:hypothetical protein